MVEPRSRGCVAEPITGQETLVRFPFLLVLAFPDAFASLLDRGDLVLTRILWLEGGDPENANTKSRYIYIHGTNQENLLGTPASHGCIRIYGCLSPDSS